MTKHGLHGAVSFSEKKMPMHDETVNVKSTPKKNKKRKKDNK